LELVEDLTLTPVVEEEPRSVPGWLKEVVVAARMTVAPCQLHTARIRNRILAIFYCVWYS
jgi:hypothetical protein